MASSHNILQWNCRGLKTNLDELQQLMACHQAAAVSVQETMSPTEIKIKGYSSYFCPSRGQDGTSGGTALYVKEGIPHRSLSLNTNLQAVAVKITVGKPFTLCSIYMPWCEDRKSVV